MTTDLPPGQDQGTFYLEQWQVDPATLRLRRGGEEVRVEPKVMEVLVYLATRPGQVITREDLERDVWSGTVVGYDALTSTIIKLRKALQDDSRDPRYIETIPKKGYRLLANVTTVSPDQQAEGPASPTARVAHGSPIPLRAAALIPGVLLILTLVYVFGLSRDDTVKPTMVDKPSLAVLPFINLNQDPAQAYFSDGITDDLINDLSGNTSLRVVARRSAYQYKSRDADIQTIADELAVNYVIDGSIRRDGPNIRINVQLVDAGKGLNIWAQRFDRQARDIFAVQDEIRESIVKALSLTLSKAQREKIRRRYTDSYEAYDLFLQGQAKLVTRASAADNDAARTAMEQAIGIDPDFTRAHAALALIHADAFRFDWTDNPEETRQLALAAAERAIEIDEQSPEAHWILAYIQLFLFENHEMAIKAGKRAVELAPENMDAMNVLAVTHTFGGDPARGKRIIQTLMKTHSHYSAMVPGVLGHANFVLGNYAESLAAYNESLLINPSRLNPNVYKTLALFRMGELEEAEFQLLQLYSLHPDFDVDKWASRQPFRDRQFVNAMTADLVKAGVERKQ